MVERTYRSKVSVGLFVFIFGVMAAVSVLMIVEGQWYGLVLPLGLTVFILSFFKTSYTITATGNLQIRSGWLYNLVIPISQITKIKHTNNPLSSPALSFDRLEIRYGKWNTVLISPAQKEDFLQTLLLHNPSIEIK